MVPPLLIFQPSTPFPPDDYWLSPLLRCICKNALDWITAALRATLRVARRNFIILADGKLSDTVAVVGCSDHSPPPLFPLPPNLFNLWLSSLHWADKHWTVKKLMRLMKLQTRCDTKCRLYDKHSHVSAWNVLIKLNALAAAEQTFFWHVLLRQQASLTVVVSQQHLEHNSYADCNLQFVYSSDWGRFYEL